MIHIVLYHPEIPANTGNIMRTCMATHAKLHIIGPIPFSMDEKSLRRAGMDYIQSVDWTYYENYEAFLKKYPSVRMYYITRYANQPYTSVDFSSLVEDVFLMFGRESTGIDHSILCQHLDHCLRIPMAISARSLNLSNSVAIVLYEVLRQQNFYGLSTIETMKGEDFLIQEGKKHE